MRSSTRCGANDGENTVSRAVIRIALSSSGTEGRCRRFGTLGWPRILSAPVSNGSRDMNRTLACGLMNGDKVWAEVARLALRQSRSILLLGTSFTLTLANAPLGVLDG